MAASRRAVSVPRQRRVGLGRTRVGRSWLAILAVALVGVLMTACAAGPSATPTESPTPTASPSARSYTTSSFVVPFRVDVPDWLPSAADVDQTHFVTWDRPHVPAVRFLVPTVLYRPGSTKPTAMPRDYLKYLLSLTDAKVHFADQKQITVGGRAATIFTATTDRSLNGTVGCPELGQKPADCFGFQHDLSPRMAVVPLGDKVLLSWLRIDLSADPQDTAAKVASFEGMLASLTFTAGAPAPSASSPAPHSVTPIDGTWTATTTYEELKHSPLLYDSGEVNDENWGAITITMSRGKGTQRLVNPKYHGKGAFDYTVDGDVLTILVGTERFAFRWTIIDDKLRLTRDDSLGPSPTGFLLKPFVRKS